VATDACLTIGGGDVHINQELLLRGTFPAALVGGIQIFLPTVAMQR
jgi:hypothetical protein